MIIPINKLIQIEQLIWSYDYQSSRNVVKRISVDFHVKAITKYTIGLPYEDMVQIQFLGYNKYSGGDVIERLDYLAYLDDNNFLTPFKEEIIKVYPELLIV